MPRTQNRRQPSMADVGRRAQVSAQTVSRYFTGGYLSPETRERVEAAITELGYRRNRLPRSLRHHRTDSIGYLNIGPINYGSGSILTGLSRAARAAGQSLLTTQLDPDPAHPDTTDDVRHALETFLSLRVDGIVAGTPYHGLHAVLEFVGKSVPIVALSERLGDVVDSVHSDSYGAGTLAVEHLASLGHTRILHLAGPSATNEAMERVRGYNETMTRLGLDALPPVTCAEWTAAAAARAVHDIDPSSFTAVFAANDQLALGLMREMRNRGFTCPDDYSIVGVDDSPDAAFYTPPLTSSRIDFERMGEVACGVLLSRITTDEPQPGHLIGADLVLRSSTAPPRTAKAHA